MLTFNKYRKSTGTTRISLLYLLLNGGDVTKVQKIEPFREDRKTGGTLQKLYAITTEFFDTKQIEDEVEAVRPPILHNEYSFQIANTAPTIYDYHAMHKENPLYVNDMGIITRNMYISNDQIVSESLAKPLWDCNNRGFMYFVDYVLKNKCVIGKWIITYENETLCVSYDAFKYGENPDNAIMKPIHVVIGTNKTSTLKLVIYTITKASQSVDEWLPDNFEVIKHEEKTGEI